MLRVINITIYFSNLGKTRLFVIGVATHQDMETVNKAHVIDLLSHILCMQGTVYSHLHTH